mgnify:FL=1
MKKSKILTIVLKIKNVVKKKSKHLHEPIFRGNEIKYLKECIKSTFVSSTGKFVDLFEKKIASYTKSKNAVAIINGTSAIHILLKSLGVKTNDEVIVPSLTFIATANAVKYCGAHPNFVDIEEKNLGICPGKLKKYLEKIVIKKQKYSINKNNGRKIKALVAVHIFGVPCNIIEIKNICKKYNIKVIEDAAEALGSFYLKKHLGNFTEGGVISFNGNKTITAGNGGIIITNNNSLAKKIKHLSTTAKIESKWEYDHDEIGYNYRLSNINAAIGCAQIENIKKILIAKKKNYDLYQKQFKNLVFAEIIREPQNSSINHWLIRLKIKKEIVNKNNLLKALHKAKIKSRPVWKPLNTLKVFKNCQSDKCNISKKIYETVINLPSSPEISY